MMHDTLFSRGSTPPVNQQQQQQSQSQSQPQPTQSQQQQQQQQQPFPIPTSPQHHSNTSSPNLIESLFQNISSSTPSDKDRQQDQISSSKDNYDSNAVTPNQLLTSDPALALSPPPQPPTASSLLSMLNNPQPPSSASTRSAPLPPSNQSHQPQQVPTPPGSSQRSNASPSQSDNAKNLLDSLIGASGPRSLSYSSDTSKPPSQVGPSPPYSIRDDIRGFTQPDRPDRSNENSPRVSHSILGHPQATPPQQPPSPRRSMFEFTSAFDHLSSSTGPIKKKPVPVQQSIPSSVDDQNWVNVADPKRQSVENLLENLTRGQNIGPQPQPPAYEAYLSGPDFSPSDQSSGRSPLPPIPNNKPSSIPNRTSSPRGSPNKPQNLHRPQPRSDVDQIQQGPGNTGPASGSRRDKESSPGPRGGIRKGNNNKFNKPPSPQPQSQQITIDVSQSLQEIQARDSVKATAIALVRQEPNFLPGTTIGATHWVAYAMTKGRVRVISRSSGDRTLLQLPSQTFSQTASVIDMAVCGNRLAGVTSDGGFVVWELPEQITDDVPGRIILSVHPANPNEEPLRAVKWHPKEADVFAVASDSKVYVIDLADTHILHGQPLEHSNLDHIGQVLQVTSPVVAFDFDITHHGLATISQDSTLVIWNLHDSQPYTYHKIPGSETPSSLTFVDGGMVVGRKNGTIFQLLSMTTKTILSTVRFVNGDQEDLDMFGHVNYDSRIQTLWVANIRRESLFALRVHMEPSLYGGEETVHGYIEQVVEFVAPKSAIHFVILTANADPHGDEAHAACIAAKIQPGELALVAFAVHPSGVDQVVIRQEWYDEALVASPSKFPNATLPPPMPPTFGSLPEQKPTRQPLPVPPAQPQPSMSYTPPRVRTPPADDTENDYSTAGKGGNKRNIKEDSKDKAQGASAVTDSSLSQVIQREIKKTEESLHSRLGKLIGKEMDRQNARFEEARQHEQAEDFARQEKILKLISTELSRNTTRVVEQAVKAEVHASVLPSLESITRSEVKKALTDQINVFPIEMEKILLRPAIANHLTSILSSALAPMIEHQIKDILNSTFFKLHSQQAASMQQEVLMELRKEMVNMKAELNSWHNEATRGQESTIHSLEHSVRALQEQVKFLTGNSNVPRHLQQQQQQPQNSPSGPPAPLQSNIQPSHLHQSTMPPNPPVSTYGPQNHMPFQAPPPQQPPMQQQWYNTIAAPQASHPATIPQPPPTQPAIERSPPVKADQWDEIYLGVLHAQEPGKLRDLLARTDPDLVLPLNGQLLVSQAVVLTLIHRLSAIIGDSSPTDENFKTSLWWLQRVAALLRPEDKLISDFIPRVIPTVQQSLNTTKQRLAILPGGPGVIETSRQLTDVQEVLRRKVSP